MARRAQTHSTQKRGTDILEYHSLVIAGKRGGGERGGEGFWVSRKSIKRGGKGLRKLTAYRLLMKRNRTF